jgi:hypothetical protein
MLRDNLKGRKTMKKSSFEQWIETLDDRALTWQWVKYCAPSESGLLDPDRANAVYEAMLTRGLFE